MSKNIKQSIIKACEPLLNERGFTGSNLLYHRRSEQFLEIVYIYRDKYEAIYRVYASIVFLKKDRNLNNINYNLFQLMDNDLGRITPFECKEKFFLKGDRGMDFILATNI